MATNRGVNVIERFNDGGTSVLQYNGILWVCAWNGPQFPNDYPITMWRFMQDPQMFPGWPHDYVNKARMAVFANEPDIEHYPGWYAQAIEKWRAGGGLVAEPAWHDEKARVDDGRAYDARTWHCYAGDFSNRARVLARSGGSAVIGTEYASPGKQNWCFNDLSGIPEQVYLFAWEWPIASPNPLYTLRGMIQQPETPVTVPTQQPTQGATKVADGNVIIQAGHINIENNCDHGLRGETGASHAGDGNAERTINEAVALRAVALLMNNGVGAQVVDANYNCDDNRNLSHPLVLALHCNSNPPAESGWDVGTGNPNTDGAVEESARLMKNVAAQYEAATGLTRRSWCQGNPNVQEYYLFNSLPSATPFALIEMCNTDLDNDWAHEGDHLDRMAYGVANAILGFLSKPTLSIPADARPVVAPVAPHVDALAQLDAARVALDAATNAVDAAVTALKG